MVEASVHVPFAGVCVYCHIKVVLVVAVLTHVVHWFNTCLRSMLYRASTSNVIHAHTNSTNQFMN